MTGRRKSGRKAGASTKKDSPEKSRRSSRRRGHRKSESEEEESGSDTSLNDVDATRTDHDANKKDGLSDIKEDESGGSDGSWQVKSENGNKGGIPKLKICLQRPPEMSSPTSEPLTSPKPRKRRGLSPSTSRSEDVNEEVTSEGVVKKETETEIESERRSARSRRIAERKEKEEEEAKRSEEQRIATENLEREAREKEEEKRLAEQKEEERRQAENKRLVEEAEKQARILEEEREKEIRDEEAARKIQEEKAAIKKQKELEELATKQRELEEREARQRELKEREAKQKELEEKQSRQRELEEEEARKREAEENELSEKEQLGITAKEPLGSRQEKEEIVAQVKEEEGMVAEVVVKEEELNIESVKLEQPMEVNDQSPRRDRRSKSRDSSEERAKQAALRSRKKRHDDTLEDGEVPEGRDQEASFPIRSGGRFKTSTTKVEEDTSDIKQENVDDSSHSVVRKRRWGSSRTSVGKKSSLLISTDVLKEIIPEAKPLPLNEVQLSPNAVDEENENTDIVNGITTDNKSDEIKFSHKHLDTRRRSAPSDESEKDYEEEGVDSGGEEMVKKVMKREEKSPPEPSKPVSNEPKNVVRRVIAPDPLACLAEQRSPSPARNPPSTILYITNLVRPFTVVQLRDLLARTGTIVAGDGFWIDSIKSRCYVKYTTEDEAVTTRNALHGVRWPASNPKQLSVDFGKEEDMKIAAEGGRPPLSTQEQERRAAADDRRDREREVRVREREQRGREREQKEPERGRDRERERDGGKERIRDGERSIDRERKRKLSESDEKSGRTVRKVTIPVREWDLGKAERGFSPPIPGDRRFNTSETEERRKREKERSRRSSSLEPSRKVKKKDDAPATKVMLDDLFRKTKATPSIYWLPLTAQQIAVREEMRRKHMEQHEKQLAEQRKRLELKRRRPRSKSRSRSHGK